MQKTPTPPEFKANQTQRQIQPKTPTPPELENPIFFQLSLDKHQGNHRSLKQQGTSKRI
jgi:hypothetical protein